VKVVVIGGGLAADLDRDGKSRIFEMTGHNLVWSDQELDDGSGDIPVVRIGNQVMYVASRYVVLGRVIMILHPAGYEPTQDAMFAALIRPDVAEIAT
jgi:hypothetical protein